MYIYCVYNSKGGVGKTSFTASIAATARNDGARVLVIDMDPQANLTFWLGHGHHRHASIADIIADQRPLAEAIMHGRDEWAGVDCIGARFGMEAFARMANFGQESDLHRILRTQANRYDLVILDSPPNAGFFALSALIAADVAVIVSRPDRLSIDGMANALETVSYLQARQAPHLHVAGVVINDTFSREHVTRQLEQEIRSSLHDLVITPSIPHRVAMAKAAIAMRPISALDDAGARDLVRIYCDIYRQVCERICA